MQPIHWFAQVLVHVQHLKFAHALQAILVHCVWCNSASTGAICQYAVCNSRDASDPLVCSSYGNCTALNTCACQSGYATSDCPVPVCYGILATNGSVCSIPGTCSTPNVCSCANGPMSNTNFGIPFTNPSVCSSHGFCVDKNSCSCQATYSGSTCNHQFALVSHLPIQVFALVMVLALM